jgi:hypothetical protein
MLPASSKNQHHGFCPPIASSMAEHYNWVFTKALQGYTEPAGTYWMVNDSWLT